MRVFLIGCAAMALGTTPMAWAQDLSSEPATERQTVLGIGGLFVRAKDPAALTAWYDKHLGVSPAPTDMTTPPWISGEGVTVFAPFAEDTDYFADDKQFMLDAMRRASEQTPDPKFRAKQLRLLDILEERHKAEREDS